MTAEVVGPAPCPKVTVELNSDIVRDAVALWLRNNDMVPLAFQLEDMRLEGDFHCMSSNLVVVFEK